MQLFEQEIHFKTLETLESFMELSKARRSALPNHDRNLHFNPNRSYVELVMTRFGFGRRSGQTTAIIEYMKKNPDKNIIYVTFSKELCREAAKKVTGTNSTLGHINSNHRFYSAPASLRGHMETGEVEIIFDEVSLEGIRKFFDSYLPSIRHSGKILGVVSMGTQ